MKKSNPLGLHDESRDKYEERVCQLMNQYFDLLLVHSDQRLQPLAEVFSKVEDLDCKVCFTGYVVQSEFEATIELPYLKSHQPLILVSTGGGRFGDELINCVLAAALILKYQIPHQIQIFVGLFMPEWKFLEMQIFAATLSNVRVDRYTPHFLSYMRRADLSISLGGYNTAMNILTTGVRSMIYPFSETDEQDQLLRTQKLNDLGISEMILPDDLDPNRFARRVVAYLKEEPHRLKLSFSGVENITKQLRQLMYPSPKTQSDTRSRLSSS